MFEINTLLSVKMYVFVVIVLVIPHIGSRSSLAYVQTSRSVRYLCYERKESYRYFSQNPSVPFVGARVALSTPSKSMTRP